ncbi:MAG: IS256 family transposase [Rhodothermaceae bacterium]|nr:MAG: IS256 family transposase [Rhodothermaceae bacterium]GIV62366.1 MAG: IS256 family transposase [Rhodothermaceae bacterium]
MNKALQTLLEEGTAVDDLLSALIRRGTEALLQQSLEAEVTDFLGRDRYERADDETLHRGYRNGYRTRRLKTTEGTLTVKQPRLRQTIEPFESRLLNSLGRIEQRLERLALELYVRGLSTRDIEQALVDQDGRALLSRSAVSRLSEDLHAEYEAFATRELSGLDVVYLFVDGVYEAVRAYTKGQAILCAWAILSDGTKTLIHLEAAQSESRAAWGAFFEGLLARGMPHPLLVVHDGAPALKAAIAQYLPQSDRQRCLAHKLRNLTARMPQEARAQLLNEIKAVYYAPDQATAELLAERFITAYAASYPAVVRCFQDDLAACLVHLKYPLAHRKFIRTTNLLERAFVEEKRRTKVIPQHMNERGALKLVFAVLVRASERWRRVKMTPLELAQLRTIRQTMCPEPGESDTISFRLAA